MASLSRSQRNYRNSWMKYLDDWHDRLIIQDTDCFDRSNEKYSRSYFVSGRRTIERPKLRDTIDKRYIGDAAAMSIEIRKIVVVRYLVVSNGRY